ncbi:MAG: RNA methyltransferase [Chloroflexi bacterium]|nr:RNA methyltransferase [Chloroflexota bacterium]
MSSPSNVLLTSTQNPRLKRVVRLRKRRERDLRGELLIEGARELARALQSGVAIRALYFCPPLIPPADGEQLLEQVRAQKVTPVPVSRAAFERIAYREGSDGLVAVAEQPARSLDDLSPVGEHTLLVVIEGVEKPGNLGAILRSADAAGAGGVIVCDPATDIYNPNVVRASLGTLFSQVVVQRETPAAIAWLRERGVRIVAAMPAADLVYTEADLRPATALAMGSEKAGLSTAWLAAAHARVRIPMHGQADSLNLAMATTILLYEAVRQRASKNEVSPGPSGAA